MNSFLIPTNSIKLTKKYIIGEISPNISYKQEPLIKNNPTDYVELFIKPHFFYKEYQFEPAKSLTYPFNKDCIFFTHLFLDSEKYTKEPDILISLLT